uniref:RF_PROK_I domain-containing protein n=1 Tax=Rhabditophanes sp. KR3021 TaxID=114890 RepID=A0AC35U8V5_9BILA
MYQPNCNKNFASSPNTNNSSASNNINLQWPPMDNDNLHTELFQKSNANHLPTNTHQSSFVLPNNLVTTSNFNCTALVETPERIKELDDADKEFEKVFSSVARMKANASDNSASVTPDISSKYSNSQPSTSSIPSPVLNFFQPLEMNQAVYSFDITPTSMSVNGETEQGSSDKPTSLAPVQFTPPGSPSDKNSYNSTNSFFMPFPSMGVVDDFLPLDKNGRYTNFKTSAPSTSSSNNQTDTNNDTPNNSNSIVKKESSASNIFPKIKTEYVSPSDMLSSFNLISKSKYKNTSKNIPVYKQKASNNLFSLQGKKIKEEAGIDEYSFMDDEEDDVLPESFVRSTKEHVSESEDSNAESISKNDVDSNKGPTAAEITTTQCRKKTLEKSSTIADKPVIPVKSLSSALKERKSNEKPVSEVGHFIKTEICLGHDAVANFKDIEISETIKVEVESENNNERQLTPPPEMISMLSTDKPSIKEDIKPAIPKLIIKIKRRERSPTSEIDIENKKKKRKRRKDGDEDWEGEEDSSRKKKRKKSRHGDDDRNGDDLIKSYESQIVNVELEIGFSDLGEKDALSVEEWNKLGEKKRESPTIVISETRQIPPRKIVKHRIAANFIDERLNLFRPLNGVITKGTFLVHKPDLTKEDCPLWKADSQCLLQKFPSFVDSNGVVIYKSSSTYSGWCEQLCDEYLAITVVIVKQSRSESIVHLSQPLDEIFAAVTTEISSELEAVEEEALKETQHRASILQNDDKNVKNLQIYIEALLNHAISLDFLHHVKQKNGKFCDVLYFYYKQFLDWTFLLAVNEIDSANKEALEKISHMVKWTESFSVALNEYLYFYGNDTFVGIQNKESAGVMCQACGMKAADKSVLLTDKTSYNEESLEIITPTEEFELTAVDFYVCEGCLELSSMYHCLFHMKIMTYQSCQKKLEDLCQRDDSIAVSAAIATCMKDSKWIDKGVRNDIICRHGSAFSFPIVKKKFMLSSGPGGQNVQKVNTKAQLFCRLDDVMGVSVELKNYILRVHKFTNDDEIVVSSDKFRSQITFVTMTDPVTKNSSTGKIELDSNPFQDNSGDTVIFVPYGENVSLIMDENKGNGTTKDLTKKTCCTSPLLTSPQPQINPVDPLHDQQKRRNARNLLIMIILTFIFFVIELFVGYIGNAMSLIADSFHMLSDVAALIVALGCLKISERLSHTNTFGWARAEVLGALINSVFLLALCFTILIEAIVRFTRAEAMEDPFKVFCVGVIGLLINVLGLFLFSGGHAHSHGGGSSHSHGHSHGGGDTKPIIKREEPLKKPANGNSGVNLEDALDLETEEIKAEVAHSSQLNIKGVYLHVMSDALGSVIVIITSGIISFTDAPAFFKFYLDPCLSVILVMIISFTTIPLLFESAKILLQTTPKFIDMPTLRQKLMDIKGVVEIHDFHVWQLVGERVVGTLHIKFDSFQSYTEATTIITKIFHDSSIHSTTIQPEFPIMNLKSANQPDCFFSCVPDTCDKNNVKCCPQNGTRKDSDEKVS